MKTNYAVVNVLRYDEDNKTLYYTDNEDGDSKIEPTTVTGKAIQGNLYLWIAGSKVDFISDIELKNPDDSQYFAATPKPRFGGNVWVARLKKSAPVDTSIQYSISFKPKNEAIQTIDPEIKVTQGEGNG